MDLTEGGHMHLVIWAIGPVALLIASTASAQNIEIPSLVDHFDAARIQHDSAKLSETAASDYEEISPVGEVDDREKVLGFYASELKRTAPAMTSEPLVIRSRGDVAIITTRESFTIPGGPVRSVRVRYVAERASSEQRAASSEQRANACWFRHSTPDPASKGGLIHIARAVSDPFESLRIHTGAVF